MHFILLASPAVPSKEAPVPFALWHTFWCGSMTHLRGTWDSCSGERNVPEWSKAIVWAQIPLHHPTCVWFSPALCRDTDETARAPLWTHTLSYLFPKRGSGVTRWELFVTLGMFCTKESPSQAGWQGGNMPAKGLVTHPECKWCGTRWDMAATAWREDVSEDLVHWPDESEWKNPFIACLLSRDLKENGGTALRYSHTSEFALHRGCWLYTKESRKTAVFTKFSTL